MTRAARGHSLPLLDLDRKEHRQIIVDRERGQYLGQVSTVLLRLDELDKRLSTKTAVRWVLRPLTNCR